jgi:hypothetical protein
MFLLISQKKKKKKKKKKHIWIMVSYFIWANKETKVPARVAWLTVCHRYRDGSLGIMDLKQALTTLLSKWIIQALQPNNSNIQLFLRYMLLSMQPYSGAKWLADPSWALQHDHKSKPGSKIWIRNSRAWKYIVKAVSLNEPTNFYGVLNRGLWLEGCLNLIGPNMSKARGRELFQMGMQAIRDVWNLEEGQLYNWEEITTIFYLRPEVRSF